jgi:arylsulfatase A-like enzyme
MKDCKTPNLDALATSGVRCTAGYIPSPQCSPSRAAIITGCFQQHFGIDTTPDVPLPAEATKLAARLGPAGYRCGFVGKWTPQFQPPGIPEKSDNPQEEKWYQYYFQAQQQ